MGILCAATFGIFRGATLGGERAAIFGAREIVFDAFAAVRDAAGRRPAIAPRVAAVAEDLPADDAAVRAAPLATAADSGDLSCSSFSGEMLEGS